MEIQLRGHFDLADSSPLFHRLHGNVAGTLAVVLDFPTSFESGATLFIRRGRNAELAALADEWKQTRDKAASSVTKLVMHKSYQRIIGHGREAIPFLLRELRRAPDHWFWALTAITGQDPVAEEDRGDVDAMARAWLSWGEKCGYL